MCSFKLWRLFALTECPAVRTGPVDGPAIFENCKGCQVGMQPTLLTAFCTWQYSNTWQFSKLVSTASHPAAHCASARVVPAHRCLPAWVFV